MMTSTVWINNSRSAARGLSLIELLIALGLGAFMLIGIISLIVSVSQSRVELGKTSDQIENGRYALQLLSNDLHNAGFYGVPQPVVVSPITSTNTTIPDACATVLTAGGLGIGWYAGAAVLPVPVSGYKPGDTLPSCLTDAKSATALVPRTEALTVRYVNPTTTPAASLTTNLDPYIQTSGDNTAPTIKSGTVSTDFTLHNFNGTTAPVRRYTTNTYYLAGCDDCNAADGIPTLKMVTLSGNNMSLKPLVEGIEDMHFEYGLDLVGNNGTSSKPDGTPDCYVDDPAAGTKPIGCPTGATWVTTSPYNWPNVVSVRVHLLARSIDPTPTWTDSRTYDLGRSPRTGPFNDHYKRQVYTLVITLNNVSGSRK